jgi:hypothetical protein
MYSKPGGGTGALAGAGGLAATGFAVGMYLVVALALIVVGLLLLRVSYLKRRRVPGGVRD